MGADQSQHMNLLTDLALTFNTTYKCDYFPVPKQVSFYSHLLFGSIMFVFVIRMLGHKKLEESTPPKQVGIRFTTCL